jgi:hypothetical protein
VTGTDARNVMRSRATRAAIVMSAVAVMATLAACVLADPPAALPTTSIRPPEIVREQVVPPLSQLLMDLPTEFVVPVAVDLRETQLNWAFVVDGNPTPVESQSLRVQPDGGVLVLVNDYPTSRVPPGECHTLQIDVSYADSNGSDSVTWFYSPTGSFVNCAIFDAGPEAGD